LLGAIKVPDDTRQGEYSHNHMTGFRHLILVFLTLRESQLLLLPFLPSINHFPYNRAGFLKLLRWPRILCFPSHCVPAHNSQGEPTCTFC